MTVQVVDFLTGIFHGNSIPSLFYDFNLQMFLKYVKENTHIMSRPRPFKPVPPFNNITADVLSSFTCSFPNSFRSFCNLAYKSGVSTSIERYSISVVTVVGQSVFKNPLNPLRERMFVSSLQKKKFSNKIAINAKSSSDPQPK